VALRLGQVVKSPGRARNHRGAVLAVSCLLAQIPAWGADYRAGDLIVTQPWARPTLPPRPWERLFLGEECRQQGGPADVDQQSHVPLGRNSRKPHRAGNGSDARGAVGRVSPGAEVKIEPGALHVMLLDLKRPLTPGMEFPVSLRFRDAGVLTVQVLVNTGNEQRRDV